MIYGVILAGGSGTRLWPLSRSLNPKHLFPSLVPSLGGEKSLFQQTVLRLLKGIAPERVLTVTHEDHRFEVLRQLRELGPDFLEGILAEPVANNTLPAISWAVAQIAARDPEAIVGVFPSDHLITDDQAFHDSFDKAVRVASRGYLVTFGIPVTGPETGYGYIQAGASLNHSGAFRALSFVEKPDRETALSYLKKGNYYWNSGLFVFRVADFLAELQKQEPEIGKATAQIVASRNDPSRIKALYPTIKKISIDHGIMEKAERVAVVPSNFGWNDLGSWEAIYQVLEKDEGQNVIQGDVLSYDTSSSLLISKKGLVAAIGLEGIAVIRTDDAVLVSPRERVQDVKKIVDLLKGKKSQLADSHPTVTRPWGLYTVLEEGTGYKIKRITVNPGQKLSLQSHRKRAEHWVVIEGTARITNGETQTLLKETESTFIPMGAKHRLENTGTGPLTIIEVQTGSYLGEDDIERFDDSYGRV